MKGALYIVVALGVILTVVSCRKTDDPVATLPLNIKELKASDQFSWSTTTAINLQISNAPRGIVLVTNLEQTLRLGIFFSEGNGQLIHAQLSLPDYLTKIAINGTPYDVTGSSVVVDLQQVKSQSANYAIHLTGGSQWISVPGSHFAYGNEITLTAWVKATENRTAKIFQKGDWDGFGLGQDLWQGWQASFAMSDLTATDLNIDQRPVTGQWYHLAASYDGSVARLYIDGILARAITVNKTLRFNSRNLSVGSDNGNQKFFAGLIDEVTLWSRALPADEISSLMASGPSPAASGLVACYRFNEGSGATVTDESPSHFNGTLVGATFSTDVGYGTLLDDDNDGVSNAWDDYPNDNTRAFDNFWPQLGWSSLAFEDLWPAQGDYDFNDLVTDYRFTIVTNAQNKVTDLTAVFAVRAVGGSFHNGFGFQLSPTIPSTSLSSAGSRITAGYMTLGNNGLETGQTKPTFVVFDDAWQGFSPVAGFIGINTSPGTTWRVPDTLSLRIGLPTGMYTQTDLNLLSFNPFMVINGIRGREIHLPDHEPTSLADPSLFGTGADDSDPASGRFYKTNNNLPWALNISDRFDYPSEKSDILKAHLRLAEWAQSEGVLYPDWFLDLEGYRNPSYIFSH